MSFWDGFEKSVLSPPGALRIGEKKAGLAKGFLAGVLGVEDLATETLARQAGKAARHTVAPVVAAGGTAAVIRHKDRSEKKEEAAAEKTAFWRGFGKAV
jgi:hypothetical protein